MGFSSKGWSRNNMLLTNKAEYCPVLLQIFSSFMLTNVETPSQTVVSRSSQVSHLKSRKRISGFVTAIMAGNCPSVLLKIFSGFMLTNVETPPRTVVSHPLYLWCT